MNIINNLIKDIQEWNKESFTKQEILDLLIRQEHPILESNGVKADPNRRIISVNNTDHYVPKKVFELIYYFISRKGKLIRRSEFLSDVWGDDVVIGHRTVDVHIRKVRKVIGDHHIISHKGVGYSWVEKH